MTPEIIETRLSDGRVIDTTIKYDNPEGCVLVSACVLEEKGIYQVPMILWFDNQVIFCPKDLRNIQEDFDQDDVPNIEWYDMVTGQKAIMKDGLPYKE